MKALCIGIFGVFASVLCYAAEVTETYEYDARGRLRVVKSDGSPNVEYCYDKAGNRKAVGGSGTSESCATGNEPPPPPTGLYAATHWGGAWVARWTFSADISYYELKFGSTYYRNVSGSATEHGHSNLSEPPDWIKACNDNGCSARVYF